MTEPTFESSRAHALFLIEKARAEGRPLAHIARETGVPAHLLYRNVDSTNNRNLCFAKLSVTREKAMNKGIRIECHSLKIHLEDSSQLSLLVEFFKALHSNGFTP